MPKIPVYLAHHRDGDFSVTRTPETAPDVTAAGCLIWRYKHDRLEVLIIHRPFYDDWSWPKGKMDEGETVAETAVREVREEVNLKVSLGIPLAVTSYTVKQGSKQVFYWAAELPYGAHAQADKNEVDELRWVSPKEARKLLTNASDIEPLSSLERLWDKGDLATRAVLILRHAKAKPRGSWSAAEGDRPLATTGKRQAISLCSLLASWAPQKLYSSPWVRCMQTLTTYSKQTGISIKEKSSLTEASHKRHPKKAAKMVDSLFEKEVSVALCTHRPVLPTVFEVLSEHMGKKLASHLPSADPYLVPGEMLVLQVSRTHPGKVISLEQIKPFHD